MIALLGAAEKELEAKDIDDLEYKNLFMEVRHCFSLTLHQLSNLSTGVVIVVRYISLSYLTRLKKIAT